MLQLSIISTILGLRIKKKSATHLLYSHVFYRDEKKAKKLQIPFTVHEIIHSPVERFTEMLAKTKLTEPQLQLMKDIRRRGKNKVRMNSSDLTIFLCDLLPATDTRLTDSVNQLNETYHTNSKTWLNSTMPLPNKRKNKQYSGQKKKRVSLLVFRRYLTEKKIMAL